MSPAPVSPDATFFQLLFEATPHPYLVLGADPAFPILAVNDRYLQATGIDRQAVLGRGLFEVFPDDPRDARSTSVQDLRTSLMRVLGDRKPDIMGVQKYDIPLRDGSGGFEVRYWSPVNTPVFAPDGRIAWIIHHVEDVTEFILARERLGRPEAEDLGALEAPGERMEAEVLRRAAEVKDANRALKAALEELERREAELARLNLRLRELDRLKTDFFANVSHELRTPLTLVLGPLDRLLAARDLPPDLRPELERMRRNARLLLAQVNNLLDLAKLDAGRMELQPADLDLAHLVRLEAARFESFAAGRAIAFHLDLPDRLPARVDPEMVRRILVNLLGNAFKFTPEAGTVTLRLEVEAGAAVLEVADSGPGIPAPLREVVFDRFWQADSGSGRTKGGTGLGLAIVKEFVQRHGGSVAVDAGPAGGARFRVRLPLPAGVEIVPGPLPDSPGPEAPELLAPGPAAGNPASAPAGAPRVLVVEDNPDMAEFLAEGLGRTYRVERAGNGAEGLRMALAAPPDLILSDVMMPGMTGDRLAEELRGRPELDEVPIVLLTAKADPALRTRMLRLGVADYLLKPFAMDILLARVEALVADRRRGRLRAQLQETRFQATFEQAAVGLAHVAPDGRWIRVNQRLCGILGYDRESLLGTRLQNLVPPEDLPLVAERQRGQIAGTPVPDSREARYRRRDGSFTWVNVTGSLVWDAPGQPGYFILVLEDINDRKAAEAELQALKSNLEHRVAERTAALEAANRELEAFSYAVSHDLRAPLRSMDGFSRALLDDLGARLRGDERDCLQQIIDASARMAALIEGILQLSRAGRGEEIRAWVDLSKLLGRIRADLDRAAPDRTVAWELEPGLQAWGDPRLLETLLRNLVENAWKYTAGRAPARISVRGERTAQGLRLTVADNGAGFDMAQRDRLFRPFQRLHRQDDFPGLGIGLATVARIVKRHGGSLEAAAEPGQGAVFTCVLPDPEEGE